MEEGVTNPVFTPDSPTDSESIQPQNFTRSSPLPVSDRPVTFTQDWDFFEETTDKSTVYRHERLWKTLEKLLTILFAVILFLVTLGTGLLSRTCFHIMVWHLNPPVPMANGSSKFNYDVNSTGSQTQQITISNGSYGNTRKEKITESFVDENWIWSLFLVIIAPYVTTIFVSFVKICLKSTENLQYTSLIFILFVETCHTIGLCCMVYLVLPMFYGPSASVVYLSYFMLLPVIDIISSCFDKIPQYRRIITSTVAVVTHIGGIVAICVYINRSEVDVHDVTLTIVYLISALMVSIKYWQTFISIGKKAPSEVNGLTRMKYEYATHRTRTLFVVNLWKTALTFVSVLVVCNLKTKDFLNGLKATFNNGEAYLRTIFGGHVIGTDDQCPSQVPFLLAVISIISSYICSKAAKTACVINCQRICFSTPLLLVPPLTVVIIGLFTYYPENLHFQSCDLMFEGVDIDLVASSDNLWILIGSAIALYSSVVCITSHIWKSSGYILPKDEGMFTQPVYCGVHTDISIMLNRCPDDTEYINIRQLERERLDKADEENLDRLDGRKTSTQRRICEQNDNPMIYACATMWHETEKEMTQLLKSVFRMDKHQSMKRKVKDFKEKKQIQGEDNFYDLEVHILFDDAFEERKDSKNGYPDVNDYVKTFICAIEVAKCAIYETENKLGKYEQYKTPYGGRLTWTLPGGNTLVVHLKDKTKVRHKKRWSQVMYMYYILGHIIGSELNIANRAFNTFLLALDGDVDFQPESLMYLVRRMKKNPLVGAACGRIHPIGSGPLVWYQKFEYAVSHWLQKATEHVTGCVLCSPGCFSLFRGSALMDVLKIYTKVSTEAKHFIQYDQGEDRWLCTLLLKEGYKVEYCAESDALTYAPESFYEFYNQRRRWTPSTMANILDLLTDWKRVVNKNQNVSTLFMAYQLFLFLSSLLTPGTIFLMILGAIIVSFPTVAPWVVLIFNIIPVGLFLLSCIFTKSETQLLFAGILSSVYAIVMTIVLIGVLIEAVKEGFCSLPTMFICFVAGIFIISAILHPQEAYCIMHGLLFFISVPSMSMLLVLYSLGNLHVVSWGTREVKTTATVASNSKQTQTTMESAYSFSLGKLFRCICCPTEGIRKEDVMFKSILEKINSIESQIGIKTAEDSSHGMLVLTDMKEPTETDMDQNNLETEQRSVHKDDRKENKISFDESDKLMQDEIKFWESLIEKYLKPLEKNAEKEKQIQEELMNLRNRCCLFFFLINALLVTVIYALTHTSAYGNSLSIQFQCQSENVHLEPISITFTVVFGILLLIQFMCLLKHRMSTLIHITASTIIKEEPSEVEDVEKFIQILQRRSKKTQKPVRKGDTHYAFKKTKETMLEQMVIRGRNKNSEATFDLNDRMAENAMKYKPDSYDTIEDSSSKSNGNDVEDYKFKHLSTDEQRIMKKYIRNQQIINTLLGTTGNAQSITSNMTTAL